jgi:hypothetical protein
MRTALDQVGLHQGARGQGAGGQGAGGRWIFGNFASSSPALPAPTAAEAGDFWTNSSARIFAIPRFRYTIGDPG